MIKRIFLAAFMLIIFAGLAFSQGAQGLKINPGKHKSKTNKEGTVTIDDIGPGQDVKIAAYAIKYKNGRVVEKHNLFTYSGPIIPGVPIPFKADGDDWKGFEVVVQVWLNDYDGNTVAGGYQSWPKKSTKKGSKAMGNGTSGPQQSLISPNKNHSTITEPWATMEILNSYPTMGNPVIGHVERGCPTKKAEVFLAVTKGEEFWFFVHGLLYVSYTKTLGTVSPGNPEITLPGGGYLKLTDPRNIQFEVSDQDILQFEQEAESAGLGIDFSQDYHIHVMLSSEGFDPEDGNPCPAYIDGFNPDSFTCGSGPLKKQ